MCPVTRREGRSIVAGGIALLAVISSCRGAEEAAEGVVTASLTAVRQFGDSVSWAFPDVSRVVGSTLIVADRGAAGYFTLVDLETGRRSAFGKTGSGPEEFKAVTALLPADHDRGAVWAYDQANRRFSLLDLADSLGRILDQFPYHPPEYVFYPVFADDRVIGGGPLLDAALLVTDRAGNLISRTVVPLPFAEAEFANPTMRRNGNLARLAFRPEAGDIALAYSYASRIDYFTPDGAHRQTIMPSARPLRTSYDLDANGMAVSRPENERGYQNAYGTRRHLYALFCGCTRQEYSDGMKPNQVQVWTWDGRLVADLTLDRPIVSLSVSEDDARLFGLAWEPEPAVIEWVLPNRLSARHAND
jgi:hypothetical protein